MFSFVIINVLVQRDTGAHLASVHCLLDSALNLRKENATETPIPCCHYLKLHADCLVNYALWYCGAKCKQYMY